MLCPSCASTNLEVLEKVTRQWGTVLACVCLSCSYYFEVPEHGQEEKEETVPEVFLDEGPGDQSCP